MKKYAENMKKYVQNMKKYEESMEEYDGICRNLVCMKEYEEILVCGKYKRI